MTTAISARTLRLAANAFDRFIAQKSNLSRQERDELLELADLLRAVARREGDLLLSAQHPDEMSPEAKPGTRRLGLAAAPASDYRDDMCPNCVTPWKCNGPHTTVDPSYRNDPDGGLARDDAWDAHCYAEGMAPFARGGGNLS